MNIKVTSINVRREGDEVTSLQVYFNGRNSDQSININGYVPLESDEFEVHVHVEDVEDIVKQKVIERLMNGEEPVE